MNSLFSPPNSKPAGGSIRPPLLFLRAWVWRSLEQKGCYAVSFIRLFFVDWRDSGGWERIACRATPIPRPTIVRDSAPSHQGNRVSCSSWIAPKFVNFPIGPQQSSLGRPPTQTFPGLVGGDTFGRASGQVPWSARSSCVPHGVDSLTRATREGRQPRPGP